MTHDASGCERFHPCSSDCFAQIPLTLPRWLLAQQPAPSVGVAVARSTGRTQPQPFREQRGRQGFAGRVAPGPGSAGAAGSGRVCPSWEGKEIFLTNSDLRSFCILKCGINSCWIHYTELFLLVPEVVSWNGLKISVRRRSQLLAGCGKQSRTRLLGAVEVSGESLTAWRSCHFPELLRRVRAAAPPLVVWPQHSGLVSL